MVSPISEHYVNLYDEPPRKEAYYQGGKLNTRKLDSNQKIYEVMTTGYNTCGKIVGLNIISGSLRFLGGLVDVLRGNDRKIVYNGVLNTLRGAIEAGPGIYYLYTRKNNLDLLNVIVYFFANFAVLSIYDSLFNQKKLKNLPVYECGVLPESMKDRSPYF